MVRSCHFDVTACAEARRLDKSLLRVSFSNSSTAEETCGLKCILCKDLSWSCWDLCCSSKSYFCSELTKTSALWKTVRRRKILFCFQTNPSSLNWQIILSDWKKYDYITLFAVRRCSLKGTGGSAFKAEIALPFRLCPWLLKRELYCLPKHICMISTFLGR